MYRLFIALNGVDYILFYPDLSKTRRRKQTGNENDSFAVYEDIDKLVFSNALSKPYGQNDFDLLFEQTTTKSELPIRLMYKDSILFEGIMQNSRNNFNSNTKTVEQKVSALQNDSTKAIKDNYGVEFNWIGSNKNRIAQTSFTSATFYCFWQDLINLTPPTTIEYPETFDNIGRITSVSAPSQVVDGILWTNDKYYQKANLKYDEDLGYTHVLGGFAQVVRIGSDPERYFYSIENDNFNNYPPDNLDKWTEVSSPNDMYILASEYSSYKFSTDYIEGELILGNYAFTTPPAYPFLLNSGLYFSDFYPDFSLGVQYYQKNTITTDTIDITIYNGCLFSSAWSYIINIINANTGSNILFNPNYDVNNGWCNVLMNDSNYSNMLIYSLSQVKKYNGNIFATFENATLSTMLLAMKCLFNVEWGINNNGYFQFYQKGDSAITQVGADLTKIKSYDITASYLNSVYENESMSDVKSEQFNLLETNDLEFKNQQITYTGGSTKIEFNAKVICTDVQELLSGDFSEITNNGFCLICVNETNDIIESENGILRNGRVINSPMAQPYLIENFHKTGRPKVSGFMNGTNQTFSQGGIFKIEGVKIPYNFDQINMNELYKIAATYRDGKTGAKPIKVECTCAENDNIVDVDFVY